MGPTSVKERHMTISLERIHTLQGEIQSLLEQIDELDALLRSWTSGRNTISFDEYASRRVRYLDLVEQLADKVAEVESTRRPAGTPLVHTAA
jgi:hypothetical protein